MKKLPLGIQNFKEIANGNYVYVDKTQYIHKLINDAKCYFLSRPRRFGKSLLLDTIGEVFRSDRELFKGLWIYDSGYDFPKHPVIRLDMSSIPNDTPEILKDSIMDKLRYIARREGFVVEGSAPAPMFEWLIDGLRDKYGQNVVVLIDEYDKPILDHITDVETADANRQVLRGFYGILKSMDPSLRLTFITGVTKFTKTSIFSGLNNLKDITMLKEYANICGIPVDILDEYFSEHIEVLSTDERLSRYDNIRDVMLAWYDGYSWDGESRLLNPWSLLNFLDQKRIYGFWYASGSPRFLLDLIKKKPESYMKLTDTLMAESMLDSIEIDSITIEPLLFQTGYLTIKEVPPTDGSPVYLLDIPNYEVREAFNVHVLTAITGSDDVRTGQVYMAVRDALKAGDLEALAEVLRGFFASIPYELHVDLEAYYHSIFYTLMSALGFNLDVEVSVSKGRVDAVVGFGGNVFIMEFKYKKCPADAGDDVKLGLFDDMLDEAMEQINTRGYVEKYRGSGKAIFKVAFAFLGRGEIEMRVEAQ